MGSYTDAISDCEEAIRLLKDISFPECNDVTSSDLHNAQQSGLFFKLYVRKADCYVKLDNFEDAVREYNVACEIKPEDSEIRRTLSKTKNLLKQSLRKDYYKILGIDRSASEVEIKKAYRKLALVYHPDKQAGLTEEEKENAEKKFKEVGEAYSVLTDSKKKHLFDNGMDVDGSGGMDHHSSGFGGMSQEDLMHMFYGGGEGFGGPRQGRGGRPQGHPGFTFQFG